MRHLVWKLADQTLVFADARGFAEAALPGEYPGGLLRWCARMLMTTGLSDAFWWVPYVVLGAAAGLALERLFARGRGFLRAGLAAVLGAGAAFLPVRLCNDAVWFQVESAFPMIGLLGVLFACGAFAALRPLARRGAGGLFLAQLVCAGLFVPFGNFALLAGAALLFTGPAGPRARFLALNLWWAAVPCAGRMVYGDLALGDLLNPGRYWNRVLRPGDPVPALVFFRCAREGRWQDAIAYAEERLREGKDFPLRTEIAYRLLAQLRTGTLLDTLFRYPIRTHPATTDARQLSYAGHELLFQYGLLQPARREIYEAVAYSGWRPEHLLRLGDIACLQEDLPLARRDYARLARCPFRRAQLAARLAAARGTGPIPAELAPVAEAAHIWDISFPRGFYGITDHVEDFICILHEGLDKGPRAMSEVYLTAHLFNGNLPMLAARAETLAALYPGPGPWPRAIQEALVAYGETLAPEARQAFFARLPPGAIDPETFARYRRFIAAWERLPRVVPQDLKDVFRAEFGQTFWFYTWWVDLRAASEARDRRAAITDRRHLEHGK